MFEGWPSHFPFSYANPESLQSGFCVWNHHQIRAAIRPAEKLVIFVVDGPKYWLAIVRVVSVCLLPANVWPCGFRQYIKDVDTPRPPWFRSRNWLAMRRPSCWRQFYWPPWKTQFYWIIFVSLANIMTDCNLLHLWFYAGTSNLFL